MWELEVNKQLHEKHNPGRLSASRSPDRHLRTAGVWRMNVCKKDQRIDRRPGFDTHRVLLRARVDWSCACL